MIKQMGLYLLLFLSIFLFSCAPVISEEIRGGVDTSLTFKEVAQSPDTYKGKIVLWGGEIIQTLPQGDGTTLIEVLEWPLSWRGKPKRTVLLQGKFLVFLKEPLDPSRYRMGGRITVAGEIQGSMQGEEIKSVSDPTYRYPLLLSKEIHVWKDYGYQYSTPYEPQTYDPSYDPDRGAGILRY
jgi:outer membrane lipoprotein